MTELGPQATKVLDDFAAALIDVNTPADMFPPDSPDGGVREPRHPKVPPLAGCTCLQLAEVYDFQIERRKRLGESALLLSRIDELVPA